MQTFWVGETKGSKTKVWIVLSSWGQPHREMDFGVREELRPSGEAERREMPGGAHCQGPPGDIGHWRGGVLERLFERSPLTSLAFTSSRGCWEPPKLSNSGFSPSLCRCLSAKGFEGAQRVPLFYLRMCSGMLLSSSTQRRRSGSHPESVPVICEPGQGPKQNGQSLPSW